jgi:hypothetical protein
VTVTVTSLDVDARRIGLALAPAADAPAEPAPATPAET